MRAEPRGFVQVGTTLYFNVNGNTEGEIWKSDGTEAGTLRVTNSKSSQDYLTNIDGTLFILARSSGIWRSDGNSDGTVKIATVGRANFSQRAVIGGTVYFSVDGGLGLWKSNGTEAGTIQVKNVKLKLTSTSGLPNLMTTVGSTLYFVANDGSSGYELWKSDGTESGTTRVSDLRSGSGSSNPNELVNVGGTLFFRATDGTSGYELWKSDGTPTGTVRVKDINSGAPSSNPNYLTNLGGVIYFSAADGTSGNELWKSDGTLSGTVRVKDIRLGSAGSSPTNLTAVGESIYFRADDGTTGPELWKSDGTSSGTAIVSDPGTVQSGNEPTPLGNGNGSLYFRANSGSTFTEFWRTESTGSISVRLAGNLPLLGPSEVFRLGDRLFVSGVRPEVGRELYSMSIATPPATPGDYNRNGVVDLADFEVWRKDFGSAINLAADGNNDGIIDAADYTYWRTRYDAIRQPLAASPPRRSPFVQPVASATVAVSAASSSQRDLLIASRDAAFAELGEESTVTSKRTRIAASPARRR